MVFQMCKEMDFAISFLLYRKLYIFDRNVKVFMEKKIIIVTIL